jgi:hypothetical protein
MFRKIVLSAAVAFAASLPLATVATASSPAFGPAQIVAGNLKIGTWSTVESVSCVSAGNCAASGYYDDVHNDDQSFVATETNGLWHPAQELAGALNVGSESRAESISCSSPGNCGVSGYYQDAAGFYQGYVASEVDSVWGDPVPVGVISNTGGDGDIYRISCPSDGNCAGVGWVETGAKNSDQYESIVINEVNGVWALPIEVATVLDTEGYGYMQSVSCPSAGNCTAAGVFTNYNGYQSFVIPEVNGVWGSPLPIVMGLNTGGSSYPGQISCTSTSNCTVVGQINQDSTDANQAYAVNEVNGLWGTGHLLADTLNIGQDAEATTVSCSSPGNCTAGGYYNDEIIVPGLRHPHSSTRLSAHSIAPRGAPEHYQAFVATETNGVWANAFEVGGSLNTGLDASINTLSCVDAANCVAGGYFLDGSHNDQALAVTEVNGVWTKAVELVGVQNVNGNADIYGSSCTLSGYCVIGGFYADPSAFVISKQFAAAQFVVDPFSEGSSALNAQLNSQIWSAAALIRSNHLHHVTAIGNTDSIDSHAVNLALGLARAQVVRVQLLKDLKALGVTSVKVATSTKGDTQFVASNKTAAGRALNRRVVITL